MRGDPVGRDPSLLLGLYPIDRCGQPPNRHTTDMLVGHYSVHGAKPRHRVAEVYLAVGPGLATLVGCPSLVRVRHKACRKAKRYRGALSSDAPPTCCIDQRARRAGWSRWVVSHAQGSHKRERRDEVAAHMGDEHADKTSHTIHDRAVLVPWHVPSHYRVMQAIRSKGSVLLLACFITGIAIESWLSRSWTHYSTTFALLAFIAAVDLALGSKKSGHLEVATVLAMCAVLFGDLFYRRFALHDMRLSDFIAHVIVYSILLGWYLFRARNPRP